MIRLLAVAVLVACGSRSATPTGPAVRPDAASGSAVAPVERGRTAEQCDRLIAHAVALGAAERAPDERPTAEERAAVEAELRTAWTPRCQAMPGEHYDCAMAARSLSELEACEP